MELIKYIKNKFNLSLKQDYKKELLLEKLNELVNNSYYDENTNTLVINTPTNLIINTKGTQMMVAQEGYIVQIADVIHLNPELSKSTQINIKNIGKKFDDVVSPLSKLIKE